MAQAEIREEVMDIFEGLFNQLIADEVTCKEWKSIAKMINAEYDRLSFKMSKTEE